jgi:hypothetical protein
MCRVVQVDAIAGWSFHWPAAASAALPRLDVAFPVLPWRPDCVNNNHNSSNNNKQRQ